MSNLKDKKINRFFSKVKKYFPESISTRLRKKKVLKKKDRIPNDYRLPIELEFGADISLDNIDSRRIVPEDDDDIFLDLLSQLKIKEKSDKEE